MVDNCEHVLDAAGSLVHGLLERCEGVTILATSREPLGLPGEHVAPLAPLAVPRARARQAAEVRASPATRLLVERAAEARPGFRLDDSNAADIAAIARRLDGLPLALELAAVCLRSLPPTELRGRLEEPFRLLTGGRTVPRHRTLRLAIDWSHELLSEPERITFRRLAVFEGGFELAQAERVCGTAPIVPADVAGLIARLVDRSMVVADASPVARYRLLETLRDFGLAEATRKEPIEDLRRRHRDAYLALVDATGPMLQGRRLGQGLERLDAERANIRAAIRWSLATPEEARTGLRLVTSLWRYWLKRGQNREGLAWLDQALAAAADASDQERAAAEIRAAWLETAFDMPRAARRAERGVALAAAAGEDRLEGWGLVATALVRATTGDAVGARTLAGRALQLLDAADDLEGRASAAAALGMAAKYVGRLGEARTRFEEAFVGYRTLADQWDAGWGLINLSEIARLAGKPEDAERFAREAVTTFRPGGDGRSNATARMVLGEAALELGDLRTADEAFRATLRILRRHGFMQRADRAIAGLAMVASARGDVEGAARLLGAAEAAGLSPQPRGGDKRLGLLRASLRHELGARRLAALLDEGRATPNGFVGQAP